MVFTGLGVNLKLNCICYREKYTMGMCIYCPGIHFYFMSVFLFDKYTFKLNCILRISCLGPPPSRSRDKKTFITTSVPKGHRTLLQSSNRCNFSLEAKNPEAKSPPERHHKHQGGGGRVIQNSKSRYPVIVRFHSSRFYAGRCLYTSAGPKASAALWSPPRRQLELLHQCVRWILIKMRRGRMNRRSR